MQDDIAEEIWKFENARKSKIEFPNLGIGNAPNLKCEHRLCSRKRVGGTRRHARRCGGGHQRAQGPTRLAARARGQNLCLF